MEHKNIHNINYIYHMMKNQLRKEYPEAMIDVIIDNGVMELTFINNVQLHWLVIADHDDDFLQYSLDVSDNNKLHDMAMLEIPSVGSLIGKFMKLVGMAMVPDHQKKDELFIEIKI